MSEETPETTQTYESATARLEEIIQRLDSGDAQLRETLELCEEAKTLIQYCAAELAAVDQGLKELKLEDLASSLSGNNGESSGPAGPPESEFASSPPAEPDLPPPPPPPSEPPPDDSDVPF